MTDEVVRIYIIHALQLPYAAAANTCAAGSRASVRGPHVFDKCAGASRVLNGGGRGEMG